MDISSEAIMADEVKRAIKRLRNGKAAGVAELLKVGWEALTLRLVKLFSVVLKTRKVPKDWKDGITFSLPKKGDLTD